MAKFIVSKIIFCVFVSALFSEVDLTYSFKGATHQVAGFDLSRPYFEDANGRHFLPLEGEWGLEIRDDSFWDSCYFPLFYKLVRSQVPYSKKDQSRFYSVGLDRVSLPVGIDGTSKDGRALFWEKDDFDSSILLLGWYHEDRVKTVGVLRTSNPLHGVLLTESFKQFLVPEAHIGGFPFICILANESLAIREPQRNFSPESADFLYRLACRGNVEAFSNLGYSSKKLSKANIGDEIKLIHGAALFGNMSVLKYFVGKGFDKAKFRGQDSILSYAIASGRTDVVKYLVELGQNPIKADSEFSSPFTQAIRSGHFDIVDFLTEDPKVLNYKGREGNAVFNAIVAGHQDIYELIKKKSSSGKLELEPGDIRMDKSFLERVLFENCLWGNLTNVSVLLNEEVDLNSWKSENSPLRAAILSGNVELVKLLIEHGAKLDTVFGRNRLTYLHLAAQMGYADIISTLVRSGIDINIPDAKGSPPLYTAVISKQVTSVHELLYQGADPNIRPKKSPAAVWMAVVQDERESIQTLIQYGATCELNDSLAMQLMDYALAFDIPEVVSISLEQCLTPDFSFHGAVPGIWVADYYNAKFSQQVLLEAGADSSSKPRWEFKTPDESITQLFGQKNFVVQYPKRLREKYGDIIIKVQLIIDPVGKFRFPKFLESLPWDLRLFLRESIRKWSIDLPQTEDINTAYRIILPIELASEDFGVKIYELAEIDKPPVARLRVAPVYPLDLKRNRVQGNVDVVFVIDEQGSVIRPTRPQQIAVLMQQLSTQPSNGSFLLVW